jgi:hypothetical protein
MFKFKYLPQYFLAFLLMVLIFLEGWTYYLGRPGVTFERYVIDPVPVVIKDLGLRRYKAEHSPHLFSMKVDTKDEKAFLEQLTTHCRMQKIDFKDLPKIVTQVDPEMVDVIQKSPYIYMHQAVDTGKAEKGRFCILFRDHDTIYLYLNGDL